MPITNIAWLHSDTESLSEKLVIDSDITTHLITNKDLIQSYYENFEQY